MKKQCDTGQKTATPFPKPAATHRTTLSLEARIAVCDRGVNLIPGAELRNRVEGE